MTEKLIKALIVDDEPNARKYIREMLRDDDSVEIVGEAGSGDKAAELIAKLRPDIVFLDIQMPGLDGFSMLQTLDRASLPRIIFTTAFEEYAIRAFEYHALDYLLKPFDQARFRSALDHAKDSLRNSSTDQAMQIDELLDAINRKNSYLERLLIKRNGRIIFLRVGDIDWVQADDKYLLLHQGRTKHMIRQTLQSLRSQLDPSKFVQINRSVLVNVDRIIELHPMFNGECDVQIADGTRLSLSRSHKQKLFDLLGRPVS